MGAWVCTLQAVTCIPSGSALGITYNCPQGIHPRSPWYVQLLRTNSFSLAQLSRKCLFWNSSACKQSQHPDTLQTQMYIIPITFCSWSENGLTSLKKLLKGEFCSRNELKTYVCTYIAHQTAWQGHTTYSLTCLPPSPQLFVLQMYHLTKNEKCLLVAWLWTALNTTYIAIVYSRSPEPRK